MGWIRFALFAAVAATAVGALGARPAAAQDPVAATTTPAADLRINLSELLTEHAAMALVGLQKRYDDAPDYPAAATQLDMNSQMIAAMVRTVYGEQAAAAFLALWREHIDYYVMYTDGAKTGDAAMQQQARAGLTSFVQRISDLLAGANPNLSRADLQRDYQLHGEQTLAGVDAYAARDFRRVYEIAHEAHLHIAMHGSKLATAIVRQFPQRFPGDPMHPAVELRFMLVDMLTEHTALAAVASQKLIDNAPDAPVVLAMLDESGMMLAGMVRTLYGEGAAATFLQRWRDHTEALAAYALSAAAGDDDERQAVRAEVAQNVAALAMLLSTANPNLPRPVLEQALTAHVELLAGATDAYAAGDYPTAYMLTSQAHQQAIAVGSRVATGVVAQFPQRFAQTPTRLPNTGDGTCEDEGDCE